MEKNTPRPGRVRPPAREPGGRAVAPGPGRHRRRMGWLVPAAVLAAALIVAACASPGSGSDGAAGRPSHAAGSASASSTLKTAAINGAAVLANARGFTVYSFAPDTATTSRCNGSCAHSWPPVEGPAMAGPGVTGTVGTITRSDGAIQATCDGHPLYTYLGDTAPGQARGNGLDAAGGIWLEVTATTKPAAAHHHHARPAHAPAGTPAAPPATAPAQPANPIPQGNGGDQDADNNGGPSDGDGDI